MTEDEGYEMREQAERHEMAGDELSEKMHEIKALLPGLIKTYYNDLGFRTGGNLHIVLDDGNLSDGDILFCIQECETSKDALGHMIGLLLLQFSEEEREEMYDNNHWGMSC